MTDKTIDPEQARLAIELADVCVDKYGSFLVYAGKKDAYIDYIKSKHIRDAELGLINAALDFCEHPENNKFSKRPGVFSLHYAKDRYLALVKDKAL